MTLSNIKTDDFKRIVKELRSEGWRKIEEYDNVDAWIDYGLLRLQKDGVILKFEWTNWEEGSAEGPDDALRALQARYGLS